MRRKWKTPKQLQMAIQRYINRNSRIRIRTEPVPTGQKDEMGHMIMREEPVLNCDGEQIEYRDWIVPPSVGGLCTDCDMSRDTWAEYANSQKHPDFAEVTSWFRSICQNWLEEQLLTREDKRLKGVIFNLQNNYAYREHVELHGASSVEKLLAEADGAEDDGPGGSEF